MAKKSFYAVIKGHGPTPYIYTSWPECQKAINGYKGAVFKGFSTKDEALQFIHGEKKEQLNLLTEENNKKVSNEQNIIVYTDGGCLYNPGGPGGYGIVICFPDGQVQELSGGLSNTTNNRMEMLAVIKALEYLPAKSSILLHTDSQYVRNAIEKKWVYKWQKNNWMRTPTEVAKNSDLWQTILQLLNKHQVRFLWVKGHAGIPENERCDQLATLAMQKPNLSRDNPK